MKVNVVPEEGEKLDLRAAINRAADTLWDRIVPQVARDKVSAAEAMPLMMRAVPAGGNFEIEFQPARVWQYLEVKQLPLIRQQPAFNLQLQLHNEYGVRMQGSEKALQQQAAAMSERWGFVLSEEAPLLALSWHWLGANQVQLVVRGNSRLPEQTESRTLTGRDPMAELAIWMQELLVKARDAYAETGEAEPVQAAVVPTDNSELILHIERSATLPEQVLIEDALRRDRRIRQLLPLYLSGKEREYRIKLAVMDGSWIPAWFAQHGMTATAMPNGWLVQ